MGGPKATTLAEMDSPLQDNLPQSIYSVSTRDGIDHVCFGAEFHTAGRDVGVLCPLWSLICLWDQGSDSAATELQACANQPSFKMLMGARVGGGGQHSVFQAIQS